MPWNEISRRYVDAEPELYEAPVWRGRSADKKQGSSGEVRSNANVHYFNNNALQMYKQLIDEGVAPEQARMVLPQSMMTEWYWSGTVFSFAKMCSLRATNTGALTWNVVNVWLNGDLWLCFARYAISLQSLADKTLASPL
jgi:thymidylate synthase ThyX